MKLSGKKWLGNIFTFSLIAGIINTFTFICVIIFLIVLNNRNILLALPFGIICGILLFMFIEYFPRKILALIFSVIISILMPVIPFGIIGGILSSIFLEKGSNKIITLLFSIIVSIVLFYFLILIGTKMDIVNILEMKFGKGSFEDFIGWFIGYIIFIITTLSTIIFSLLNNFTSKYYLRNKQNNKWHNGI
jgi:hypothetical protein